MKESYAIELVNATKIFKSAAGQEIVAVDRMNLGIRDGKFFALLGPGGCDKTTTLRLIAGFETPTAGEIYVLSQFISGMPAHLGPVNTVFQNCARFRT